ncbi:MAG: CoA transferase [Microbacterium sp.]|nr:CoA transferase [Microbacterium sp.]
MPVSPGSAPSDAVLSRVCVDLGIAPWTGRFAPPESPVPLPSRLAVADLAWASVLSVCAASGIRALPDPHRIALAFRSDRVLAIDATAPPVWSPYSGFWRTADGWVRTHGNYPHHASAMRRALCVGDDPALLAPAFETRDTHEVVDEITSAGGLAVRVAPEDPAEDSRLRSTPLLDVRHLPGPVAHPRDVGDRPLDGVRVLDLTRVIAGPVCTRTLALLGADVLRIDPPALPEPEWQHLDTGHGKRSALLDARSPRMRELLDRADVVVLGYRPAALERLGLSPDQIAAQHPGLVIAQLSAWGSEQPERAGFDSLVQAESGIALIESPDGERPGALPAQALDHSAGYLLATSVLALLERRRREGGTWIVRTSLRRIAAELLGMPRSHRPEAEIEIDIAPHAATFRVGERELRTVRPALPGVEFTAPHVWGSDHPTW